MELPDASKVYDDSQMNDGLTHSHPMSKNLYCILRLHHMQGSKTWVLMTVAIVSLIAATALVIQHDVNDDENTLVTSVRGVGEYNGIELECTVEDVLSMGCKIGDKILVETNDHTYDATFVKGYSGIGAMGAYVSIADNSANNHVSFGAFNVNIWYHSDCKVGDAVTLKKNGVDPLFAKMPHYIAGTPKHYDDSKPKEVFCNFRALDTVGIKENEIFRSVSPFRALTERSEIMAELYEKEGIEYILSLGDTESRVEACRLAYGDSYYPVKLYDEGNAVIMNLDSNFNRTPSDLRKGLLALAESDGKVVINCYQGKDRTGMMCIVLEALTGSDYNEIKDDYMLSYINHYGIEKDSEEYNVVCSILLDRNLYLLEHPEIVEFVGNFDWSVLDGHVFDVKKIVLNFLKEYAGMTDDEINTVIDRVSK